MSLIKYWVVNSEQSTLTVSIGDDASERISFSHDSIVMSQVLPASDVFDPPPPVRHGILTRGWRVVSQELPDSGINDHGQVDWKQVADDLAAALQGLRQQDDLEDPEPDQKASLALDGYTIAQTEAALATTTEVEET